VKQLRRIGEHDPKAGGAGRLGRHVEHDQRSRRYAAAVSDAPLQRIRHKRHGHVFDQGSVGSCTGNAVAGACNTEPLHRRYGRLLLERDAVAVYAMATKLDGFPGEWPPDDTGSSGLAACKAAVELGFLTGYQHAFGVDHALQALQLGPVVTGIDWYDGFDRPDHHGKVEIAGEVRGGHEVLVVGYHPAPSGAPLDALVECWNSWGPGWGRFGRFTFTVRTWGSLLERDGDVTVPIRA